ncbi:MAG: diphosphate--fructose-6-phosphate 1-phosphotransferase [Treponema sp.]|nr:diphosphate--fructose-6-phosphate 1-phosphotransferase [Treponema sp.]
MNQYKTANKSTMQRQRYDYKPQLPTIFYAPLNKIAPKEGRRVKPQSDQAEIARVFSKTYGTPIIEFTKGSATIPAKPLIVGIVLSGGQAPGGHNVIAGIFDAIKKQNPRSKLFGFKGGPSGLINGDYIEIKRNLVDEYRNTGGFDMIGSGRTKIETDKQFDASINTARRLKLDALVIVGGDDSNTNAAFLAKYFLQKNISTKVIGVPKTIDGDLKNEYIEASFGFDTATKLYAELIGNLCRDVNSARKYWHFIKLMGRSASHIALECALKTQPNVCLIGEEIAAKKLTVSQIINAITDVIVKRSERGENFGVVLVPEGVVEFIPEMDALIEEINDLMGLQASVFATLKTYDQMNNWLSKNLSSASYNLFCRLPKFIAKEFLMDRDPHGNVQVSRIDTEKLLISLISKRLDELEKQGKYSGKFNPLSHFFGYEGRSAFPSNFDSDYCYALGFTTVLLAMHGYTGFIAAVQNLTDMRKNWRPCGIPLAMMMHMERRKGKMVPVIKKSLVDLNGKAFKMFKKQRDYWALNTVYRFPGAIQYFGDLEVCNIPTKTLLLEKGDMRKKANTQKSRAAAAQKTRVPSTTKKSSKKTGAKAGVKATTKSTAKKIVRGAAKKSLAKSAGAKTRATTAKKSSLAGGAKKQNAKKVRA